MALGSGIIGTIVTNIVKAIIGAVNGWIRVRKVAHTKAKADALATRAESAERAQKAEDSIDDAAQVEKGKPAAADDDDEKMSEIRDFLKE